jgi:RNA polymerase sigma factor (TIGR02999 family)
MSSPPSNTELLLAARAGDRKAFDHLFGLVYQELRQAAHQRLVRQRVGETLNTTALVHEAYLRLVGGDEAPQWNSRAHFFGAAAEAMRRILVESARRKQAPKHGGGRHRLDLDEAAARVDEPADRLLDLDRALARFRAVDPLAARLVELRYFAGLTMEQAADALGLPLRTAERNWTFARTWLHRELSDG